MCMGKTAPHIDSCFAIQDNPHVHGEDPCDIIFSNFVEG